jgi:hypothetical protein
MNLAADRSVPTSPIAAYNRRKGRSNVPALILVKG